MSKQAKPVAEPSFEKALAELESIVAKMEDGGLSLEQSLAAHKRGLELARQDALECCFDARLDGPHPGGEIGFSRARRHRLPPRAA